MVKRKREHRVSKDEYHAGNKMIAHRKENKARTSQQNKGRETHTGYRGRRGEERVTRGEKAALHQIARGETWIKWNWTPREHAPS